MHMEEQIVRFLPRVREVYSLAVSLTLLLLLSGDVATNPGPTISKLCLEVSNKLFCVVGGCDSSKICLSLYPT